MAAFRSADPECLDSPPILNPVYGYPAVNVLSQKRFRPLPALLDEAHHPGAAVDSGVWPGSIEFLYPANHRILAYVRQLGNETVLVVNNLSSTAQAVELDLRRHKGNILIEMFGKNIFPRVGDLPYLLTLGPYQFYWFRLRRI